MCTIIMSSAFQLPVAIYINTDIFKKYAPVIKTLLKVKALRS